MALFCCGVLILLASVCGADSSKIEYDLSSRRAAAAYSSNEAATLQSEHANAGLVMHCNVTGEARPPFSIICLLGSCVTGAPAYACICRTLRTRPHHWSSGSDVPSKVCIYALLVTIYLSKLQYFGASSLVCLPC